MSWSNGWYFTKAEDRELSEFLTAQGLDQNQITSITAFQRGQITGKLNLWTPIYIISGIVFGIFIGTNFFRSIASCLLF